MKKLIVKIKSSKLLNSGILKKIKDKIYFKYINPKEEGRTDAYRAEIFELLTKIFGKTDWMLFCGGILRFYRDGFMDGQDIDICVKEKDLVKKLPELVKNGFLIKQIFYNNKNELTEYRLLYKNVDVDVFNLYYSKKEGYYHYFTFEDNSKKSPKVYRKVKANKLTVYGEDYVSYKRLLPNYDIKEYDYENTTFKGPKDPESIIVALYGENWKVYDPNYNPRKEPKNNMPIPYSNAKSIVFIEAVESIKE